MTPARRTIFALVLASAAIARAEMSTTQADVATTQADGAPAADEFDPAAFPLQGDLKPLTPDQQRQVLSFRALAAQARRAAGIVARVATRRPTTTAAAATTAPAGFVATVARLADRDPLARSAARSALMSLDVDALPALRDALAGVTLTRAQASALRDAVVQVVLADKHGFRGGGGPLGGTLGISVCSASNDPPIVGSRMPGWDGYRVLEDGDAILAMRTPVGRGAARRPGDFPTPIRTLAELRGALAATRVGELVDVSLLRNGASVEVELRLAVAMENPPDGILRNRFADEADNYWLTQFAPRLRIARPTTRAVR